MEGMEGMTFKQWISELQSYFAPASKKIDPYIWYRFYIKGVSPERVMASIYGV